MRAKYSFPDTLPICLLLKIPLRHNSSIIFSNPPSNLTVIYPSSELPQNLLEEDRVFIDLNWPTDCS